VRSSKSQSVGASRVEHSESFGVRVARRRGMKQLGKLPIWERKFT
jgi:hypothetical protein